MLPTFQIASWEIRTYGLLVAAAVFVIAFYGYHRLQRLAMSPNVIIYAGVMVILGGIGGTFLGGYLDHWEPLHQLGLPTEEEGTTIVWTVLGALTIGLVVVPLFRIPLGRSFDLVAAPCALGIAIGRLGCLAAGCCAGKVTSSWLGMYLPGENGVWAMRYPTQLFDALAHLAIVVFLLLVERSASSPSRRVSCAGAYFLLFMALSLSTRFALAFLREGLTPTLGPLNIMQLQGIAGLAIVLALGAWNLRRAAQSSRPHDSGPAHRLPTVRAAGEVGDPALTP